MSSFSSLNRGTGFARKMSLALASLYLASTAAYGDAINPPSVPGANVVTVAASERISPLVNTAVGNARVIIPDGTSVIQGIGAAETRWFAFEAEAGKTYNIEVIDPYADLFVNFIGTVSVTASDGTSVPPEASISCSQANRPPSLDVSTEGVRCIVRTFIPTNGLLQNKRGVYIGVATGGGTAFQLRVRESTVYGRWTTNGYDFHVEAQNTTTDSICVQVALYPNAGFAYTAGAWVVPAPGFPFTTSMTIPPMGANKVIIANGTTSVGELRGTLRIHDCGSGQLVAGGVHLSTYAYNPVTDKFLYFFTTTSNNGNANSF